MKPRPILYAAGPGRKRMPAFSGHHALASFAEPSQVALIPEDHGVLGWLLDSGAFSVWRSGATVDLDAYCRTIDRLHDHLDGYFALDVIPGEQGRPPTADELAYAVEASMINLDTMAARGLSPIPVYHEGDPDWVLEKLTRGGHRVIGLGATKSRGDDAPPGALVKWLAPIFATHPDQRFHGLGMTQRAVLCDRRLTFWSVDSTTWRNPVTVGLHKSAWLFRDFGQDFNRKHDRELTHLGIAALEYLAENGPTMSPELAEDPTAPVQLDMFAPMETTKNGTSSASCCCDLPVWCPCPEHSWEESGGILLLCL